jgi:hypothetical protein
MSAEKGVNAAIAADPSMRTLLGAEWRGKVRGICDSYEAASLVAGSTIVAGKARKGEVFLGGWLQADDLSSAGTLEVGDSGDADRFLAATVFTTAGQNTAISRIGTVGSHGQGYKFTADTDILITTATETLSGTIQWQLLLLCPN